MKKLLFGLLGLLVTISGWSAETDSGPISSVTVAGLVAQNGTPTPNTPVAINTNNGVLKLSPNLLDDTNIVNAYSATGNYIYKGYFSGDISRYFSNVKYRVAHCVLPAGSYRFETDTANAYILRYAIGGIVTDVIGDNQKQYIDFTLTTTTEFSICWRNSTTTEFTGEHSWISKGATTYHPYGEIYTDGEVETIGDSANHTATVATLLGVGDYRDTQNINTGAITRKVGVKMLDGTENWSVATTNVLQADVLPNNVASTTSNTSLCSHLQYTTSSTLSGMPEYSFKNGTTTYPNRMYVKSSTLATDATIWANYLAEQYAAGTPVIVVYPLAEPTTESVAGQTMTTAPVNNRTGGVTGMTITTLLSSGASVVTTIAADAIKIATTAYNSARFSPVVTELNDTIATIRSVVTNTINQTKAIADLQATKQTRPDETCPAGKKCLLVETEENGVVVPHWYRIFDPFSEFFDPIKITTTANGHTYTDYGTTGAFGTWASDTNTNGRWAGNNTWRVKYVDGTNETYSPHGWSKTPARTVGGMYQDLPYGDEMGAGTWAMEYEGTEKTGMMAGVIYGIAKCTPVAGSRNYATTDYRGSSRLDDDTEFSSAQRTAWAATPTMTLADATAAGQTHEDSWSHLTASNAITNYRNCWCKMTALGVPGDGATYAERAANGSVYNIDAGASSWVFYYTYSSAAYCAYNCAYDCAAIVWYLAGFRRAVLGFAAN